MELVIDANILISSLINTEGKTYDLIFNDIIKLFASEYLLEEILLKSGLNHSDFEIFLSSVSAKIKFIQYAEFSSFISKSEEITPDKNDAEYFALALKLNCPIWSNDKKLKEQRDVKIYSTSELIRLSKQ